ncbi:MAG: hypothetical protein JXA78_14480 [Anaerolineales bacterium]|nr:hypothetical protein [Anaerolineales bacterium]
MTLLRFSVIAGLLTGGAILAWRIAPARSKLLLTRAETHFPLVSGYNLNRQELVLPRDFGGELNLVIVPFQQYQQVTVNTWIPFAQETEATFPGFMYYELPTIYQMPAVARTFVNEGMRAGIPNQTARQRTVTLYIDKDEFKSALDIPNEDDIYLFLVDRQGDILWRTSGEYSAEKAEELLQILKGSR